MLRLTETAKRTVAAVARKYRLEVVVLFGSRARRRASPMSDTDVAVWSASELSMTRHLKLGHELEKALPGLDLVDLRRAPPLLLGAVAQDGVPLFESRPGAFAEARLKAMNQYLDFRPYLDLRAKRVRRELGL